MEWASAYLKILSIRYCLECDVKSKYIPVKVKGASEDSNKIEVADNGIGISEEHMIDEKAISHGSIGLIIINNRIHGSYGEAYEISIESRECYWTKVTVKIPKL